MGKSLEEIFRENLKFYRQKANVSQEKLSAKLDKNINYINMIEGGKSLPPIGMIEQIGLALDVEPYKFLTPNEEERVCFGKKEFIRDASSRIAESAKLILKDMLSKDYKF